MKKILILAASLLVLAAPSVSAEKKEITKKITVSEFTAIDCNLPSDIEYVQGPASFKVVTTQKSLDHLVVTVKPNGELKICFDKTKLLNTDDIKIWISSETLNEINLNGNINFEIKGLDTDDLTANLNGASELEIEGLSADNAVITANGAASLEIKKAECEKLETKINGAGDCEIEDVECNKLVVTVNGAGGSTVSGHAKEALLTINGVGGIDAQDLKADTLDTSVNGIGKITRDKSK